MCGIVGYLDKTGSGNAPVGRCVVSMLEALGCRGPDSAGVAVFGPVSPAHFAVRVKIGESGGLDAMRQRIAAVAESFGADGSISTASAFLRFEIGTEVDQAELVCAIEALGPDVEVVSIGRSLQIAKQVGSPESLDRSYHISEWCGSHALGHTRLSTESRVDLSHSQPFWAHDFPDLAIVHNGHITNYHQLRRRYEQRGVRFYTENDSEVIAVYLAERLGQHASLADAFQAMLRDLDGSFSCLAATDCEIGFVKDPFAFKPLVVAETDAFVAMATEEVALRSAIPGTYQVREAQTREWRVWRR